MHAFARFRGHGRLALCTPLPWAQTFVCALPRARHPHDAAVSGRWWGRCWIKFDSSPYSTPKHSRAVIFVLEAPFASPNACHTPAASVRPFSKPLRSPMPPPSAACHALLFFQRVALPLQQCCVLAASVRTIALSTWSLLRITATHAIGWLKSRQTTVSRHLILLALFQDHRVSYAANGRDAWAGKIWEGG
ncbi:hypothetical protein K438DRAFT_1863021, partial [Mycena galopus ATCC 62051]